MSSSFDARAPPALAHSVACVVRPAICLGLLCVCSSFVSRGALHASLLPRGLSVVLALCLRVLFFLLLCGLGASLCLLYKFWLGLGSITTGGIFPGCRWAPHTDSAVKLMDNQVFGNSRLATFFRFQRVALLFGRAGLPCEPGNVFFLTYGKQYLVCGCAFFTGGRGGNGLSIWCSRATSLLEHGRWSGAQIGWGAGACLGRLLSLSFWFQSGLRYAATTEGIGCTERQVEGILQRMAVLTYPVGLLFSPQTLAVGIRFTLVPQVSGTRHHVQLWVGEVRNVSRAQLQ